MEELVVLVDEENKPIGIAPKSEIHTADTPLHRGFSVFLFNSSGQLLLQRRSKKKKTFPLVWSNSCCGHPGVGERPEAAAKRRLKDELGIEDVEVYIVLPNYRYRAEMNGIIENETCPVMVAFTNQALQPNPGEVEATRWVKWQDFLRQIAENPSPYSPWAIEEAKLLQENKQFRHLYERQIQK